MKPPASKSALLSFAAVAILFCSIDDLFAQSHGTIKLNKDAPAFAARLIREGHVIADGKGAWRNHRPSTAEVNEFIRVHGIAEYAKWHLGIDERYGANAKGRYKFPYGDFKNVHRCGLLAARSRARQYGYSVIENAAAALEREIKIQPRINTDSHTFGNSSVWHLCKSVALSLPAR